jgi:heptaprenyl diphosphate synthase
MKAKKIALLGVLCAVAMVMSYLETFIPTPHPAVKIGLPNVIIVFILYKIGIKEAIAVSLIRVLLISIIFGSIGSSLPYSLAGAVLSLGVMILLKQFKVFSTVAVSIAGGVMHNVGQIVVSCIIMDTSEIAYLLPALAITAVISGTLVGIAGHLLIKKVKKI